MVDVQALYWADKIVEQIKDRLQKTEMLQKQVIKRGIVVYDEKTPSGRIHIGSGRGWVIHDKTAKTLRNQSLNENIAKYCRYRKTTGWGLKLLQKSWTIIATSLT